MEVVVGSVSGEAVKSAAVHLEREFGYLLHFKRNVRRLRDMHGKLTATANDVQTLITAAGNNDQVIRQTVQDWLNRAVSVQEEAHQLVTEAGHVSSWFRGWCCSCSRFSLGRKAETKNALIQGLLDERIAIGDTVSDPKPFQALPIPSDPHFNAFASREIVTNQVMESLSNEKISLVGVHGMPGVGKTMLIKAIAKQVKLEKLFQEVVIVIVSQNPVLEKIQRDIAKGLGLNLPSGDTSFQIAARLSERLNKDKAVLIVFDDVWERLELAEVGIPFKNQTNGCKVVFTTRHESVCNHMESDSFIGVPVLTEEDSWILFREKVGEVVDSAVPTSLSRGIVSECKGLPLAVVTLGLALRNIGEVLVWEDTLTQLKKSIFEGLSPVVSSIRLSYDFLQNDTAKLCFLFCCLFPEDYHINTNYLLTYLVGENILKNVDSVDESRGRLESLVGKLVASNLLLRVKKGYVMMHDVIRDVAISIASEDEKLKFTVKAGMGLIHWPNMKLSECKRLSVMNNKLRCDLPYIIQAPQLITLCMGNNKDLKEIPSDFFNEMGNLLNLDLSGTGIRSLPSSLSCLVKLRTLLIERCELDDISPIKELEKLETLSFYKCNVTRWLTDVRKLSNMKLLDLSYSRWGEKIPAEMLASLSHLEDLSMLTSKGFLVDDIDGLPEVRPLARLTSLKFRLSNLHLCTDIPNLEKLIRFSIFCISDKGGPVASSFLVANHRFERILYLVIPKEIFPLANWVSLLVKRAEYLHLEDCPGIESVGELDETGMNDLKVLHVQRLPQTKYLANSMAGKAPKYAFRSLEELHITYTHNFEAFCRGGFADGFLYKLRILIVQASGVINLISADLLLGLHNLEKINLSNCTRLRQIIQLDEGYEACDLVATNISHCPTSPVFPNLKEVYIRYCHKLEYVIQLRVTRGLPQLKEFHVTHCRNVKTIIEGCIDEDISNAEKHKLILPRLENLRVARLPELSTLSPPGLIMDCPHLEKVYVRDCWKLKRLPFRSESVPKLELLCAEQAWLDDLEWDHEGAKSRLHQVFNELINHQTDVN